MNIIPRQWRATESDTNFKKAFAKSSGAVNTALGTTRTWIFSHGKYTEKMWHYSSLNLTRPALK